MPVRSSCNCKVSLLHADGCVWLDCCRVGMRVRRHHNGMVCEWLLLDHQNSCLRAGKCRTTRLLNLGHTSNTTDATSELQTSANQKQHVTSLILLLTTCSVFQTVLLSKTNFTKTKIWCRRWITDVSPLAWTFHPQDVSYSRHFALRTFRNLNVSPSAILAFERFAPGLDVSLLNWMFRPWQQEIWANTHEMHKSLFLFTNCQSISSHLVTVHSWVCAAAGDRKNQ